MTARQGLRASGISARRRRRTKRQMQISGQSRPAGRDMRLQPRSPVWFGPEATRLKPHVQVLLHSRTESFFQKLIGAFRNSARHQQAGPAAAGTLPAEALAKTVER